MPGILIAIDAVTAFAGSIAEEQVLDAETAGGRECGPPFPSGVSPHLVIEDHFMNSSEACAQFVVTRRTASRFRSTSMSVALEATAGVECFFDNNVVIATACRSGVAFDNDTNPGIDELGIGLQTSAFTFAVYS